MNKIVKKIKHTYRVVKSEIREKQKSKKRSSHWDETRDVHIALHPTCEACGSTKRLQVHHILPFHEYPELELCLENLITLCMSENECHINIGHKDNFSLYNPNVRIDAKLFMMSNNEERIALLEQIIKKKDNDPK